ncbi:MAG TPA: glycosyltransferase family 39 protein [Patescibacteria group bacterium]|nr:glycosyltransferase family 39 protein [Patescibacteria group bacterium]
MTNFISIKFIKKYWVIIAILILASFLRFWKLGSYPALNADEAAIGYNAYSLIQTGMDEHGHSWPIHFQSFNDYKPGLYFYLVLPFVKLLGLSELAVRIPGAFLGVLSVFLIYLLVMELFDNERFALVSALFISISPWHIQFSRGGWEVNTATFFIVLGVLMFLKAVKKPSFLTFTFFLLPFTLSLYTYHAARVVTPILALSLLAIFHREIFDRKKIKLLVISFSLLVILLIPLFKDLLSPGALSRVAGVGLFADPGPINRINEQRGEHGNVNSVLGKVLHNKVVNYGIEFTENWLSHYSGEFLFMSGDSIERNKVPETGEMYLVDIVFLGFGFVFLSKKGGNSWKFIISWLVLAPIASALTFQSPNALRAQNMVVPLTIISAFGLVELIRLFNQRNFKIGKFHGLGPWLVIIAVLWCFTRYLNMYYVHMSKIYPYSSQYGLKELVAYVSQNQGKYKDVFVTNRYDQPYILFLFFMKYPPQQFQGHHTLTTRDDFGFSTVSDFDKYHFEAIDLHSLETIYPDSLVIGTPEEIPQSANIIKRIYGTNGFEYFDIVAN